MITQEVTAHNFIDWMRNSGSYKEHFSYEGAHALFDYLSDYSDETGENMDFDPVAWCVEFTEFANLKDVQSNYDDIKSLEDLEDNTAVIPVEGTERLIIADF